MAPLASVMMTLARVMTGSPVSNDRSRIRNDGSRTGNDGSRTGNDRSHIGKPEVPGRFTSPNKSTLLEELLHSRQRFIDIGAELVHPEAFHESGLEHYFHRLRLDRGEKNLH